MIKKDAILHAIKEDFDRQDMVKAIMAGRVIEKYPERSRVLICGEVGLSAGISVYLHVVCQYSDPVYVEIVTAYIPNETVWERPPYRRKEKR